MEPNLATVVALGAVATGLIAGVLSVLIARAPGWKHLRWFAWASVATVLFGASDTVMSLHSPEWLVLVAGHVNLLAAGSHGVAWFFFFAEEEGRPLSRFERLCVGGALVGCALALVPGLYMAGPPVAHEVPALGIRYLELSPEPAGGIFYFWCLLTLCPLLWLSWRAARRRGRFPSLWLGFMVLFGCIVNDIFAALNVTGMPYLVNVGLMGLAVSAGANLTADVVLEARRLQEYASRLEQTRAALVARERLAALGELAAVVAHEVRNPLAVIFNAMAALRRGSASGDQSAELLRIVQEEAERLSRLVNDLLDFVKPYQPRRQRQELRTLLLSAAELATATRAVGADAVQVECGADVQCEWDPDLVRQALSNLIANALESPGRKGAVRVLAAPHPPAALRVAVVDDGAGVSPEHLSRLFSPFFTTRQTGTGLGLALVRRIAEAHGGTARHEPTPGGGATFVLELPPAPPAAPPVPLTA